MAKKANVEVEGFLDEVSEVNQSGGRCRYFSALLQEAQRNSRVVVFDVQKHNVFQSAEKDRTPVKLCDVAFAPSRQKKGEMDILVNSSSALRCVRQLDFVFDESLHEVVQDMTIDHIVQDPREYQRVNVVVKVIQLVEDRETLTRSHLKLKRRAYDVADKSNSICLSVWGGEILQIGQWYAVTNVSVRQFGGETCLSTTINSKVTMVGNVDCEVAGVQEHYKEVQGQVVTADVKVDYMCPKQHVVEKVNFATAVTRCQECGAFFKTRAALAVLRAQVSVEDSQGQIIDFLFDDFVLRHLLKVGAGSTLETDVLVAKLLAEEPIEVKCRANRVMSAAFLPACSDAGSNQAAGSVLSPSCSSLKETTSELIGNCSTMQECSDVADELMLDQFFGSESEGESSTVDSDKQNKLVAVEVPEGKASASTRTEGSFEANDEREQEISVAWKLPKREKCLKQSGKGGKKK